MKSKFIFLLILMISGAVPINAQEDGDEWEIGIGGSAVNLTRTMITNFHQTRGGDYVFEMEDKHLYGGAKIYLARGLSEKWFLDLQGTMGLAKYYESGEKKQGYSFMAGPGVQFRPIKRSQWIVPYLRVGVNAYHKTFATKYMGTFDGDVTKEGQWVAEDAWNKGYTADNNTFFPASFGIGVIGWLGNRVGIRIQGEYLKPVIKSGPNFIEVSAGINFRLGGKDKRRAAADSYIASHLADYDYLYRERFPKEAVEKDVVREVPVEKEVIKYVNSEKEITKLMGNVHFGFDRADLTPEALSILDQVAKIMSEAPEGVFMIAGHTDSKGSGQYNNRLSEERARAVREALVERGVDGGRLIVKGFGERISIFPESSSDKDRRFDRKVVIEKIN